MRIFNLFKKTPEEKVEALPWLRLHSVAQLDEIEKLSETKTVIIFKHSTRCGISRMVLRLFEGNLKIENPDKVALYYLDLLAFKDLSNEVSIRFQVLHQSPQALVIKNRKVVYTASHHSIQPKVIETLL